MLTQDLRVAAAADGMQQATLQQERTQTQYDTYDQWIREGRNDAENNTLDAMRAAELAHVGSGVAHLAASWKVWTVANNLASALSETAAALSTEAQMQQTKASFERRKQEWELSRNLAAKDAALAAAQVDNATLQHTIALQDKAVAVQHADYAATVAEFLATKFTNADLYRWMSGVLGRAYAYLLQQATAVARLAQAQLAFERQEPLTAIVAGDYWRVGGGTAGGQQPDRGGMTGSVRLLADLVRLDQHAFETDRRKLHLSQTFALSELAADELQRFRDTGRLTVATTQELFDRSFPGHYLRLVKKVKVTVVALVPALRGLRATLSASGVSRAVVARGPFDTVTLRRDPESIAFTSPLGATGLFDLEPEGAMLLPFEGMGVDAVWQLELPKAANPFDYRGIADVLLSVDYTALDSPSYRQTVIRSLDRSFSADRTFSLRNDVPDAWFQLGNPDGADPAGPLRARLPLTRNDFPPNVDRLAVAHLSLFVLRVERLTDELTLDSVTHTVAGQPVAAAAVRTVGGIVSTRRAGGAPLSVFIGADPAGDWELAIDGSAATRSWFAGGLIQDVVLVLSLSGTLPAWG